MSGRRPAVRAFTHRMLSPLGEFLQTETAGGVVLLAATAVALVWANSPWSASYGDVWHTAMTLGVGDASITDDLRHWVNDALMVVFFFVVGLEIKRELVTGELRDRRAASLPALAAVGGMVVPAAIYIAISGAGEAGRGWGIPMATDIAFVVGVLAVLGPRIPSGLKLFLLTLAIIDDIGAIAVIAIFYSEGIEPRWLAGAVGGLALVVVMRSAGVWRSLAYVPVGVVVWVCTFQSGVHATIAGVALGLLTPARPRAGRSVVENLEHRLHPWSSFLVVPLFALANAGVELSRDTLGDAAASRLSWGVLLGLLVGKTVGITAVTAAAVRFGAGRLAHGVTMRHVVGGSALAGIGFTVSLFVTGLAFRSPALIDQAKVAILVASTLAGCVGAALLLAVPRASSSESGL